MKTNTTLTRFLTISTLALGISMTAPISAFAAGHQACGQGGQDHPAMEMAHGRGMPDLRGIDLSAAQVAQLASWREEQKKQGSEKFQALRDQHDALRKLVMSEAYTPAAAAEIIARIGAAQSEMAKLHAEQGNRLYKLLTPEQRTKLQQNELLGHHSMGRGEPR